MAFNGTFCMAGYGKSRKAHTDKLSTKKYNSFSFIVTSLNVIEKDNSWGKIVLVIVLSVIKR